MSNVRRAIGILTSIVVIGAGVVVLQTRAADQAKPPQPVPPKAAVKSPAPGAPQVREESATIRDDPTIAPDPKQSADNNVSFPNDI
jgi:hypothetical protein